MRLAIDCRCLVEGAPGGIARYAAEVIPRVVRQLQPLDHVGFTTGWSKASVHIPALPMQRYRQPNKLLNSRFVATGRPYVDQWLGTDVLFAPTPKFFGLSPRAKSVITVHDLSFVEHPEFFTFRQRLWHWGLQITSLLQHATRIIAVSAHTQEDIVRLVPGVEDRVRVIPSGADHVPPGPHTPLAQLPEKYILAFAPSEARKNVAGILAAHALAFPQHHVPLVLVGSGAPAHAPAGIIAQPYLTEADRWRVLANAQLLLYPSLYEGFGFPPLEAMALGVPVIASHVTSLPTVLGEAALLVDPWDPQDIAQACLTLLTNPALHQHYQQFGQTQVRQYTWDACAEKTAAVLRECF
ncbi:MAG: glycosyltransferase family 1 protein [Patescibacteria group bacterium]|jgi:glycosyltransferase involved in cell wall biosynthesis